MMRTDWNTMCEMDHLIIKGTPWINGLFTPDAEERLRSFVEKGKGD